MLTGRENTGAASLTLRVASFLDALSCSREAGRYAADAGFDTRQAWEVSIAVSELATNIVRYAGAGTITMRPLGADSGIEVIAEDDGPGFDDIESALVDGYSDGRVLAIDVPPPQRAGLGAGLGAVGRLMDSLDIANVDPHGARIVAVKRLRGSSPEASKGSGR